MTHAGKVFVVTGGNSGIGYGTAKLLLDEGAARVYITGRNPGAINEAAKTLGTKAIGVVADAASIPHAVKLCQTIQRDGDKIDGLLPSTVDEATFDEIFNINLKGAFFTIQKLLPVLKDGSSIVLNASAVVYMGFPATTVYSATKAGMNSLAKTLSRDLLPRRIRVNVVNPGAVTTPILGKMGLTPEQVDETTKGMAAMAPLGRTGRVDEIAGYVSFLLSDKSTFILGTELAIDGGMSQL